jgi:plastocyanin
MTKRIGIIALAIGFAAGCGGGGGSTGPDPAPSAVEITTVPVDGQPRFSPSNAELAVGGTVTWRIPAAATIEHNVTSNTNAWVASPDLSAGQTFQVTFPQAGEFLYQCTIHPGMVGRVEVR